MSQPLCCNSFREGKHEMLKVNTNTKVNGVLKKILVGFGDLNQ